MDEQNFNFDLHFYVTRHSNSALGFVVGKRTARA